MFLSYLIFDRNNFRFCFAIPQDLLSNISNIISQLDVLLDDYLDYSDYNNYGLLNNSENLETDNNMYQNLYNYISLKSSLDRSVYSNYNFFSNDLNLNDNIKLNPNESNVSNAKHSMESIYYNKSVDSIVPKSNSHLKFLNILVLLL